MCQRPKIAIDVNNLTRTLLRCVQSIAGLGRLKLFFSEPAAHRVGVKPEPVEEPVLVRRDNNHLPNAVMVRAVPVNDLDSLINLE